MKLCSQAQDTMSEAVGYNGYKDHIGLFLLDLIPKEAR